MHVLFRARVGNKLYYQDDQYLTSFLRRIVESINIENGIVSGHESYLPKPLEEYLEQWTGLTDRNGVKIFEGDRVVLRNTEFKVEMIKGCWMIAWDGTCFGELHQSVGQCEVLK